MRFTCLGALQGDVIWKWISYFQRQSYITVILVVHDSNVSQTTLLRFTVFWNTVDITMILKKVEGRRNPRAWHGSRLTVSGLHGHPSTPNPRPKRRVETPGDPWGVPQPPGPSSPAFRTPHTANMWFLPLSSSKWGQTLPTTSVMFPVRTEPRGHAQGGKKIPGGSDCISS